MEKTKNCPYCGEEIMADARKCKHCGEWLDESFVQDQDSKANKRESETDAKPKQNNSAVLPQSGSLKETTPIKKNKKWLLAVIPVAIVVFCAGLYFGGVFNRNHDNGKSLQTNGSTEQESSKENETQVNIRRQVLEAFNNGSIYETMTSEFKDAENAAREAQSIFGDLFFDKDIFYDTQVEIPDNVEIKEVNLVENDRAYVKVMYVFSGDYGIRFDSTVLVMVQEKQISDIEKAKWLVDDIWHFYVNNLGKTALYSKKVAMKQFVDEAYGALAYVDDEYEVPDNIYFEEDEQGNEVRVVVDDYGNETRYPAYEEIDSDDDYQDEVDADDGYMGDYQVASCEQPAIKKEESSTVTQPKTIDENTEKEIVDRKIYQTVEEMPAFPGGEQKLMEYVAKNINYPQNARETGIQGRVFVGFVVESDGSISNVTLLKGIGGGCDEEAVRVIKSLPKWEPGKERGKAVRVSYQIPVFFRLQ